MLQKHVQTVKEQIEFFDYKLNKYPKDSKIQATYWPLKYKFEQLLQYLKQQNSSQKNIPQNENTDKQTRVRMSPGKTQELENKILEIIKLAPDGIHVKQIYENLLNYYPSISYSKVANRVSELYAKQSKLIWVNKGIYKVKET